MTSGGTTKLGPVGLRPPGHLIEAGRAADFLCAAGLDLSAAEPDHVRHKPGESTMIGYRFTTADGLADRGYIRWFVSPHRADEVAFKAASLRPVPNQIGSSIRRLDRHTILFPFPNDTKLRRLRWYTSPRKLKRSLATLVAERDRISGSQTSVEVLAYKPERRVVADIRLSTASGRRDRVFLRYGTAPRAGALASAATLLRSNGVLTPKPVTQLDNQRVSIDEFIVGAELRGAVRRGFDRPGSFAEALVRFHSSPIEASSTSVAAVLRSTQAGLIGFAAWDEGLGRLAEVVGQRLTVTAPTQARPCRTLHGDLHDKNVMVTPAGDLAFVDLERMVRGPAAHDLGRLRANALAQNIRPHEPSPGAIGFAEGVVEGYRQLQPAAVDDDDLRWYTAVSLVDQALLATRHLEPGWLHSSRELLGLALTQLARPARPNRPIGW